MSVIFKVMLKDSLLKTTCYLRFVLKAGEVGSKDSVGIGELGSWVFRGTL